MATVADLQGQVYPGVRMMRTVAVTRDFLLDIFQVNSDAAHTYDYLFHSYSDDGAFVFENFEGKCGPVELNKQGPWKWLRDARAALISTDWSVRAAQRPVNIRFAMVGAPSTEVILCSFPRDDKFSPPPVPMLVARRTGNHAVFIVVLQAEKGPLSPLQTSVSPEKHARLRVCVKLGDNKWEFSIPKLE
jgi:hypothetical protein